MKTHSRHLARVSILVALIPMGLVLAFAQSSKPTLATKTAINGPTSLALYKDAYLFVVELADYRARVLRIDLKNRTIMSVAGNGKDCCYKEGGRATQVAFRWINSIAVDSQGDLFIGDDKQVRRVDAASGLITTVAGNGSFESVDGLAVDRAGNLFISDRIQGKIFEMDSVNGTISRVAGSGKLGFSGDGGSAVDASFRLPKSIALDSTGNIFVADSENCRIRRIDHTAGIIETVAQTGGVDQNCPPQPRRIPWQPSPSDPAVDSQGNIYFVQGSEDVVARIGPDPQRQTIVAGTGGRGFNGDGLPAKAAQLADPAGLAVDSQGNIFISEYVNNRIRRVDAKTGIITTVAGNGLPHRMDIEM